MLVIWVYGFRLSFFPPPSLLPQLLKGQLLSISPCAGTCTDLKAVIILIQNNHINLGEKIRRAGIWSPYNRREYWRPTDLGGVHCQPLLSCVFNHKAASLSLLLFCTLAGSRDLLGESHDASPYFMQDPLKISPDSWREVTSRNFL